jgi:hypothetical protein
MSSGLDLSTLNTSSTKVAACAVRICSGRVSQHTYSEIKNINMVTAHKFEAWWVNTKAESYSIGFAKGTATAV